MSDDTRLKHSINKSYTKSFWQVEDILHERDIERGIRLCLTVRQQKNL